MPFIEILFWTCAAVVLYTYAGYPLLLALIVRLRPRPVRPLSAGGPRSVSFVLAAHNEEASISRRLDELGALIADAGQEGEVVLVSDGSTDGTAAIART